MGQGLANGDMVSDFIVLSLKTAEFRIFDLTKILFQKQHVIVATVPVCYCSRYAISN